MSLLPLVQGPGVTDSPFQLSRPEIFDEATQALVRQVSGGLAEPRAALPQDEPAQASSPFQVAASTQITQPAAQAPAPEPATEPAPAAEAPRPDAAETRATGLAPGSFEKLREMLDRLRQSNGLQTPAPAESINGSARPDSLRSGDATALHATDAGKAGPSSDSVARAALMGRFEALKLQMSGEAEARQVEAAKIALQHNLGLGGAAVVTLYRKASL